MGVEVMFLQTHYTQLDKFAGRQITAGKKVASPTAVNAIRKLEERFHKVVKDNNLKEVDLITQLPEPRKMKLSTNTLISRQCRLARLSINCSRYMTPKFRKTSKTTN